MGGELRLPALLSHQTSLTKHKVEDKIISNFNIEHSTKPRILLSLASQAATMATHPRLSTSLVLCQSLKWPQRRLRAFPEQSKHCVSLRAPEWIWHGKSANRQPHQRGEESICSSPWPSPGHHAAFQAKLPSNTPQPCHPYLSAPGFLYLLRLSSLGTYQKYIFELRFDLNSSFSYHSYDK